MPDSLSPCFAFSSSPSSSSREAVGQLGSALAARALADALSFSLQHDVEPSARRESRPRRSCGQPARGRLAAVALLEARRGAHGGAFPLPARRFRSRSAEKALAACAASTKRLVKASAGSTGSILVLLPRALARPSPAQSVCIVSPPATASVVPGAGPGAGAAASSPVGGGGAAPSPATSVAWPVGCGASSLGLRRARCGSSASPSRMRKGSSPAGPTTPMLVLWMLSSLSCWSVSRRASRPCLMSSSSDAEANDAKLASRYVLAD